MKVQQKHWTNATGWSQAGADLDGKADLVFAFGSRESLAATGSFDALIRMYPGAHVVSASTAGEILGPRVLDDTMSVTAVRFDGTRVRAVQARLDDPARSLDVGRALGASLDPHGLRHVFVLAEGLHVDGGELERGLRASMPRDVVVTGGLAGDGTRREATVVGLDAPPQERSVVAIGFYGERLRVGHGSIKGPGGAVGAVFRSKASLTTGPAQLALLVQCEGRKRVLDGNLEAEVSAVAGALGRDVVLAGFVAYGAFSPGMAEVRYDAHDEALTITTLSEAA